MPGALEKALEPVDDCVGRNALIEGLGSINIQDLIQHPRMIGYEAAKARNRVPRNVNCIFYAALQKKCNMVKERAFCLRDRPKWGFAWIIAFSLEYHVFRDTR